MKRTNPEAAALRAMSQRLHRRAYQVAGPNSLWHLDGNHKLIRWRIVIHGGCLERQGLTTSAMQSVFGGGQGDAQEEPEREGGADAEDVVLDWPERVTVPPNQHLLRDEDMEQLTAQFDPPAGRREDLGLGIIRNMLSFMATLNAF
ncbi:hypothetical protein PBY51_023003 [Eleginops maclovinus]|uniref:Integrase core domain-containing protein n=1 Tax=Eleginops maclovinus TaxID=56733 RepID=A0AAN7XJ01_ELEMC|nr:hypothetical protein PBY51_023003 [Eleginops maclovinus]